MAPRLDCSYGSLASNPGPSMIVCGVFAALLDGEAAPSRGGAQRQIFALPPIMTVERG